MAARQKPLHVVFGANGSLGSWIVRVLDERGGIRIRAISRSGGGDHGAGVESMAADASDEREAVLAAHGAAVVYHCINTPYPVWAKTLPKIMQGIIRAAETAGAKLVYADNVYAYGVVEGPIRESLPWKGDTKKGRIRADVLSRLFRAHEEGRIRATAGMASDFYGPGGVQSHLGDLIFPRLLAGKAGLFVGNPQMLHTFSYIEDVARGLVTLALDERADGQTWHTPNLPPWTMRQILDVVAELLGRPVKLTSLSPALLRLMGLFSPMMRELQEMLYQFHQPFIVEDNKFRRTFGSEPTPLEEGLARTLAWYRAPSGKHQ